MNSLNSPDDSRSVTVTSPDLSAEDITSFKALALTVAESSSHCLFEVEEGEFEVKRPLRKLSLDPLIGGGSVLALIVTMSLAAEFTPIALIFLVISFLMPDTSRLLFEAIHRKFKKPIMLDAATVSISSEKSVVVEKAKKFGFVTKYTLMPNNSLRIVLQLPEDCDAFLQMLE